MTRLAGKTAVITGAGSGLGRAAALRFGTEGAHVLCTDLDAAGAAAVAAEITAAGGSASSEQVDTTSSASLEAAVNGLVQAHGRVDVMFANAGINGAGNADDITEDYWNKVIAVNLTGVWLSAKAVLPHMIEARSGVIINQASMAALIGLPDIFPYTAAKGGVTAMTRQMAVTYGPMNVRVNAICPGTIPTPLVYKSRLDRGTVAAEAGQAAMDAEVAQRFPLRRLGKADDVASLAVFLASDESDWITGAVIPVDGGRSAF